MDKRIIIIYSFVLLASCNNNKEQVKEISTGDTLIKAKYLDGKMDGKVIYSLKNKNIIAEYNYRNGARNGIGMTFYSNKRVLDSTYFVNDKRQGYYYLFDSLGKIFFKRYYIDGTAVGPIYEYRDGILIKYGFKNFEKKLIFYCEYDSNGVIKLLSPEVPYAVAYTLLGDVKHYTGLFAYFPNPPGITFTYFLCYFNKENETIEKICRFNSDRIYIDTLLEKPKDGNYYSIMLQYVDSSLNKVQERIKVLDNEE